VPETTEQVALGIGVGDEALLKALLQGVALCDLKGCIRIANNAFLDLLGARPAEIVGTSVAELFACESRQAIDEAIAEAARERAVKGIRADCLTSKGALVPVWMGFSPLKAAEGDTQFVVISVRDLTREEQLAAELNRTQSESESLLADLDEAYQRLTKIQDELLRKERLAVSGELAASVAHEIRNPLAIIGMSVQYLHSKLSPGHAFRQFTTAIVGKVKQLDEITTQLINYGCPRKLKLEARDLHRTLNHVLCLASSKCWAQKVKIIKRFDRGPSKVTCDHGLMNEVFTNLVVNALQAMRSGGVLRVETQFDPQQKQAVIQIADTGCGISPKVQAQLFKPFFTTKRNGTGLGLAICHRIIDQHHGSLSCTSKTRGAQRGTTFTITIPLRPPRENSQAEK
jgi:PAS domain S-box-containing protein